MYYFCPIMKAKKKEIQPPCCWTIEELHEQVELALADIKAGRLHSSEEAESHFNNYQYEK